MWIRACVCMFVGAGLLCARCLGQLVVVQPALLQLVDGSDAEQFGVRPQCWLVRGDQIRFERIVAAQLNGCLPETSTLEHRLCVAGCVLCVVCVGLGWAGAAQHVTSNSTNRSPGSDCSTSAGGSAGSAPAQSTAMWSRRCSRAALRCAAGQFGRWPRQSCAACSARRTTGWFG